MQGPFRVELCRCSWLQCSNLDHINLKYSLLRKIGVQLLWQFSYVSDLSIDSLEVVYRLPISITSIKNTTLWEKLAV